MADECNLNVLVVDDDPQIRSVLEDVLEPEGHRVAAVSGGFGGIRKAFQEPFDIIFLDINMPGVDGATAFQEIKSYRPQTLIVIITGAPEDARVEQMIRMGAHKCLPKPLDYDAIIATVEEARRMKSTKPA